MPTQSTKSWMERKRLKSVTVYFHEMVFERVKDAAKENGQSKGRWIHNIVIERLRKRVDRS